MQNKKLKSTSSSKKLKESEDDDFKFHFSYHSRSKSTPRRVRFAEKPLCPESDPEDNIINRDRIKMRSGEPPQPILKDTEYVPPKPSYLRLLRRRFVRKARRNSRKIIGIALFLIFSFVLFELMFRWGSIKSQFRQRQKKNIDHMQSNFNEQKGSASPLFVGYNLQSELNKANSQYIEDDISNSFFNISGAILASIMTALIGIALYFLVL